LATFGLFVVLLLAEFNTVQRLSRAPSFASSEDASAMLGSQIQFQVIGRTIGAVIAAPLFFQPDGNLITGHALCCGVAAIFSVLMFICLRVAVIKRRSHQESTIENNNNTYAKFNSNRTLDLVTVT